MALFKWNSSFETGHPVIDSQHRHWVDLLNQLNHAVNTQQQRAVDDELLQQFIDYTHYHFSTEERLMAASGYADQASHHACHREFAERIQDFRADKLRQREGSEFLAYLMRWLSEHILTRDQRLVSTLLDQTSEADETNNDRLRQHLFDALQESENRFRVTADGAPMPLWICDDRGRRTFVNHAWITLTGHPETAQLDQGWQDLIHPDDRPSYLQQYGDSVKQQQSFEAIYRVRCGEEAYRWISEMIAPRRLDSQEFVGLIGAAMDITPLKEAEQLQRSINERLHVEVANRTQELSTQNQELQNTQQQLVQSEKMAAIGHLAAGVAHEINNPVGYIKSNICTLNDYAGKLTVLLNRYEALEPALAGVEGYGELQAEKSRIDPHFIVEDIQDLISETQEGLARVQRIVQDLKDFSRVDGAEWEAVDLHQFLDSTLNIANNEIKYRADVVREYGELPLVECMPHSLCQVFMNLLVNAAQAIEQHGTITLRTFTEQQHVRIEIEDNGNGIPEAIQSKIFDPFFTTKAVGSGTGLGLSISYGIVEKHHGTITVRSRPGEGTCFGIRLPINQPGADEANAPA